jgi:cytochrome c-type biogenesis protein
MSISLGCLVCVGGTLLASLLVYAGASGSPLTGGLTLLLFSIGMSIPFLLAAFAFDKVLPRFDRARSLIRYSAPVAGAVMMTVGLLILSGNDSVFERLVV